MKTFALIGAAGYVAPRHLRAISENGGELIAAMDPSDSVGILDSYFPSARFFTDMAAFERLLLDRERSGRPVDYVVVCSPNDLHAQHCKLGMALGADVICEKPLALDRRELDQLAAEESRYGRKLRTVLQLRLMPQLVELRHVLEHRRSSKRAKVRLRYITPRGPWYQASWKGSAHRSGGIAMNIGVHLFDLLLWLFGECDGCAVTTSAPSRMEGTLELSGASVSWLLSTDGSDLPSNGTRFGAHRSLSLDGDEIEFSLGFSELHTLVYQEILAGNGWGVADVRPATDLVDRVRSLTR